MFAIGLSSPPIGLGLYLVGAQSPGGEALSYCCYHLVLTSHVDMALLGGYLDALQRLKEGACFADGLPPSLDEVHGDGVIGGKVTTNGLRIGLSVHFEDAHGALCGGEGFEHGGRGGDERLVSDEEMKGRVGVENHLAPRSDCDQRCAGGGTCRPTSRRPFAMQHEVDVDQLLC